MRGTFTAAPPVTDLEAGKPLELDAIIVAVIELADLTGLEVPSLPACGLRPAAYWRGRWD